MGSSASDRSTAPGHWLSALAVAIVATSLVAVALITLWPLGATRMYAWPWSWAYGLALAGPACALLLRAADARRPLHAPATAWTALAIAAALLLLGSAFASPFRHPSLRWAAPLLSAIAVFFVVFDWLHGADRALADRRARLRRFFLIASILIGVASLVAWLARWRGVSFAALVAGRNPFPLGHSNYTAGLAVLMLPIAMHAILRRTGTDRRLGIVSTAVALAMLFSSGSRGGVIALAALAIAGLVVSSLTPRRKIAVGLAAMVATLLFVAANPRTRALLTPTDASQPPNLSNVQRSAMLLAGFRMGADRPIAGWGPGTTPLVYPRYRAAVPGGAENVLQLHSLPMQLWAETGGLGLAVALVLGFFIVRRAKADIAAAITLGGYAVFAVFDYQLDVPVVGWTVAALCALVAPAAALSRTRATSIGAVVLTAFVAVVWIGRADSAPPLNAEALTAGDRRPTPERSIALLEQSLAINPDQEIAHFNLGWFKVADAPVAAARHFTAAAHLVPDKGGVYFGLGLARLNGGDRRGAVSALALEVLNDPLFVLAPWWDDPQLGALLPEVRAKLQVYCAELGPKLPPNGWTAREVRYVALLAHWAFGEADANAVAAVATTTARREFFSQRRDPAVLRQFAPRQFHNERVGYPVLMRDLDLAVPLDEYLVRESGVRSSALAHLWPAKGWLPSPLLIALLDEHESRKQ